MTRVLIANPGDTKFSLEDHEVDLAYLQSVVGGYIEHVTIARRPGGQSVGMYVNEEGRISDPPLPLNTLATALYGNTTTRRGDYIAGPAVIVGGPDEEGGDVDVPDWFVLALADHTDVKDVL